MKFIKKHKTGLIILLVVVVAIAGLVIWFRKQAEKALDILTNSVYETAVVEERNLVSVVSATGKIVSLDSKDVNSLATGSKIKEVNVEVGDEVKAGDILFVLDSEKLESSLESTQNTLDNSQKSANVSVNSAQRMYNEQAESNRVSVDKVNKQIEDLKKDIEDFYELRDQSKNWYDSAAKNTASVQSRYNAAYAAIAAAEEAYRTALAAYNELSNGTPDPDLSNNDPDVSGNEPDPEALAAAALAVSEAEAALSEANTTAGLAELTTALQSAQSAQSTHLANYNSYVAQIKTLENQLQALQDSLADTVRQTDSALAARKDSLTTAKLSASNSTSSLETQVENLEEQIAACVVTAPIDGVVTSVNATVGSTYSGMSLATIEDVSAYEITTEIDEYDIGKIQKGQRVVIKTNGTGDEELAGTVKSVAPRASMSASMGGSVTYTVVISIDSKNSSLKLDMTAKLSIVLDETNNTLTIPLDSLYTDDEGKEYVKVVDGKDATTGIPKTHDVYVKTGIRSDYYVEILDGVKKGDEVNVERTKSSIFDFSVFMSDEGAMGGM